MTSLPRIENMERRDCNHGSAPRSSASPNATDAETSPSDPFLCAGSPISPAPMAEPVVEGMRLGRRFGSVRALADLTVEVRDGERLTIFGPNGAGKTTLVKVLATLLRPT